MPRAAYAPKRFLSALISEALADMPVADGSTPVNALGFYGEKGVVFFKQDGSDEDPDAAVGFTIVGRDIDPKHYNLGRSAARELVRTLIEAYHFRVNTATTPGRPQQVIPATPARTTASVFDGDTSY